MALTDAQLNMLDTLIYTEYFANNRSVKDIIGRISKDLDNGKAVKGCEMSNDEWRTLIDAIRKQDDLLNYRVTNYVSHPDGFRAACFVDKTTSPTDVNVIIRGSATGKDWHDNGEGAYVSDSGFQKTAAAYVEGLPDSYGNSITISGHSKGGNLAQYATIVTDRIDRCVSIDGQGFSPEFLEKYKDEIARKRKDIVSISASKDVVNALLFPIAGTQIYISTEKQDDFFHYHKPNILLDENGNFRKQVKQDPIAKLVNSFSCYMIEHLEEPEKSYAINGLLAIKERDKGPAGESLAQTFLGLLIALEGLDDYILDTLIENSDGVLEKLFWNILDKAYKFTQICRFPRISSTIYDLIKGFAISIYVIKKGYGDGAIDYRDFSQSALDMMLDAVQETEDEAWWRVDRWDCWYRLDKAFGGTVMNFQYLTGDVDTYYRKVIDMNDASKADIRAIFEKVYDIDNSYSREIGQAAFELNSTVATKMFDLCNSISVPG